MHQSKYSFGRKPNEVQMARGRLKDALHDLVANSDEEQEDANESNHKLQHGYLQNKNPDPESNIYNDKPETCEQQHQIHESFVMKLFDRSLDLSKYDNHTALYPICRAWMANAPRSTSLENYRGRRFTSPEARKNNGGEALDKLRNGRIVDINTMPAPLDTDSPRIVTPLVDDENEETRQKTELGLKGASKAQLLAAYKQRWKKVRQEWQTHTKRYNEEKYSLNYQIIDELYRS